MKKQIYFGACASGKTTLLAQQGFNDDKHTSIIVLLEEDNWWVGVNKTHGTLWPRIFEETASPRGRNWCGMADSPDEFTQEEIQKGAVKPPESFWETVDLTYVKTSPQIIADRLMVRDDTRALEDVLDQAQGEAKWFDMFAKLLNYWGISYKVIF